MNSDKLIAALSSHQPHDAAERAHRDNIIAFVSRNDGAWWKRGTLDGHVTASAWIVNAGRSHALLLHHAKLNRWVQPGGHIDDTDPAPVLAAMREAREETGLIKLALDGESLFDVDVHAIPARGAEPRHFHYDLRYLVVASDSTVNISAESLGARWIAMTELTEAPNERSISRMAKKTLRRAGAG